MMVQPQGQKSLCSCCNYVPCSRLALASSYNQGTRAKMWVVTFCQENATANPLYHLPACKVP